MTFVPLYQRIKERIRADLLAHAEPGEELRLPTERELEARYHVSRPTISKALTALAAEGLLVKAQGRGSFAISPPLTMIAPAALLPRRIGYVAPVTEHGLVQSAFRGIDHEAHRRGYCALMGSAGTSQIGRDSVRRERAAALELIAAGARGLIIYPSARDEKEAAEDYLRTEALGVPVVLIDTCIPEQGHAQVIFDNRRVGYAMTSWLVGKGNRRIALLSYAAHIRHDPLAARLKGYQDALHDHGIAADPGLIRRYDPAEAAALPVILDEWLTRAHPPTAIIAPEDMAAMDVIECLPERGIRVPEDVRVVGFDHREGARRFRPAFTTTNPDFERMGEIACDLLLEGLESGEVAPRTFVLEVPLLVRRCAETPPRATGLPDSAAR